MIKIFSNKTNVPKITVQSKFLKNKTTVLEYKSEPKENDIVQNVKSNTLLFVRMHISGLLTGESIGKIQFALAYEDCAPTCGLQVIQCPQTTLTESYMKEFANSLTGNEAVEEAKVIYKLTQSKKETEQKGLKFITFDVTNMAKKALGNNSTIMFVIKTDNTSDNLNLYNPEFVASEVECCSGTMSNFDGLNGMYKFDKHSIAGSGTGYVNLYNRKLIHVVDGLTSLSKKMPITYSTIHNYGKSREKSFLAKELTPSFQYIVFKSGNEYVIEDPTGNRNYYAYVDQEKEEGQKTIATYGIKHLDTKGDLYFCNIDNSYLFLDTTTSKEIITVFDQQDNKTIFEVMLNVENIVFGRFTKILSRETKFGDKLSYQWNETKLEKMINSDGEQVLFTYDSSSRISKVDFPSLKQYIQYTYALNEWKINIACYSYGSSPFVKLKEVELNYEEIDDVLPRNLMLSDIVDKITGCSLHYDMSNTGIVSSVLVKNEQNEIGYKVNYSSNSNCTTTTSFDGKKHFYYFDNYGRCKLEMDDKGRSITYNYDEFEHGETKHLTSVSNVQTNSRNLLENHSFEDSDNLFKDESLGWKKAGDTNSKIEVRIGGVYGEKYLLIDKVANETITISQDVIPPGVGKTTLKGFIKHQAKIANENINLGNIKIKVSGTYTRKEDVITIVDSTTTKTENRSVSHYYNEELATFSGNSNWEEFVLTTNIPNDAYDITMKVEIVVSGISCEVGIDDLQLCTGKQKTRYNLIENGYMEFAENNLPKGWVFVNREEGDMLTDVSLNDEHTSIFGEKVMKFAQGSIEKDPTTMDYKIKKMYKEIPCHGLSGEQLIFSVFAKAFASSGNIFRSYMKIYHTNGQYRDYTFDFDKNFQNWQMLTRAVTAEYDFDKVEVGVEYSGGNEALFDCFQLYKDSYGKYYNYDERGNITEVVSDDGNSMRIDYDEDNQVREVIATDGSSFKYNYDESGRLESVTDLSGNVVTITYDENDYVIKTTITTPNGECIVNSQERNKWGEITKAIDEHGNQTLMGFNYLNQITKLTHSNELVENYTYNNDTSLNCFNALVENKNHQNSFVYDDSKQVKSVESANGTKYNFVYDSFGRLKEIDVNGEIINQFSYDETINNINKGLVSRKRYGVNGDYFDFIYNEDDEIKEVKLNGVTIVEYKYNENGEISEIKDIRNNTSKHFTYDLRGKLVKVVDNHNQVISYTYDNLDHLQKTSYKIGDVERSFDYEYDYETNEYTKEGYFNRLEREFSDEVVKGGNNAKGTYGAKTILKTIEQVYDEKIKMNVYQFSDNYDFIWYNLESFNVNRTTGYSNGKYFDLDAWKRRFYYNKTFYMWIKPSGTFKEENLFRFQKRDENEERTNLAVLNISSSGKIGYKEESKNYNLKTSTNALKLNEWNLVGIKIFKNKDETNSKCILFINDEVTDEFTINIKVNEISDVVIASQTPITTSTTSSNKNNVSTSLSLPFKVCMMSFGSYNYKKEDINAIYNEGLKYLVNESLQKATGVSYYNVDAYKDFDVITLNGSLESTRGNKPVKLMKTDSSFKVEKARIFKYEPSIQRHVYGAFDDINNFTHGNKSLLAYNLNLKNKGVISFKFKPEAPITNTSRYVVSSFKDESMKMGIYISSTNELRFAFAPKLLICRKLMEMDKWYTVTLFYSDKKISIYIDGEFFYDEELSSEIDLSDCVTYIGSDKDGTSALNGYVEVFAYSDKESNIQANIAKSIYENGNTISIRNHLDSLGRVKSKVITTNSTTYTKNYAYDKLRITREIEPDTHNIKYEYDSVGNIIKKQYMIKDIVESTISYEYDKLNRLTKEIHPNGDIETFTYDANGNIITHQLKSSQGQLIDDETYHYSLTNKDQLISITDGFTNNSIIKEYKYENSYKGNPTAIITNGERKNLVWEGRKLKQVGDIHFTYNEDGIRVKKQGPDYIENYILDGSNIIGLRRDSEGGSYDMFFNYDEQGEIVGLSCEGKEYFYIRDITGNISKIVDETGRNVVSYEYDAWGNFKKTIHIDCRASHSNPFVYKGYFFDSETNWYYLKSRYYDPSIRRFISADNFNYLDSESLNGLNLYSYCGNNPVLGYDPEGTWSWNKFWGVVTVVAIAAVAVAAVVTSVGAASAAVAPLAFMYFGISASTTYVATVTVATIVCTGIAAFAIADTQEILTNGEQNYLGFLGEAYDPIKTGLYSIAYLFPMMGQYAQPGWGRQINSKSQAPKDGYGPKYGAWIQNTKEGINRTIYGGDGRQIYRIDCGEHFSKIAKEYQQPHIHHFVWYYGNDGKWHYYDEVY